MTARVGRDLGRTLLLAWATGAALLLAPPAHATTHFLCGLLPGPYTVTVDGEQLFAGLETTPEGTLTFRTDRGGRFVVQRDTLIVPQCADLAVIPSGNQPIACGAVTRVRVKVKNQGQVQAAATFTTVSLDGLLAGQAATPAIAAGAEVWTDWLSVSKAPGRYLISGCADTGNQIAESDETNNCSQ